MGVATTAAPYGFWATNPTEKLAHWVFLLGQPLSRNLVFQNFSGEPPPPPLKELGLSPKYRADDPNKLQVKKLAALAFVPVADVVACFQSLATIFLAEELPLLAYFEGTWIVQSVGGWRPSSTFPYHMWNVLDRSAAGSTRTTNSLEATSEPQLMTSFEGLLIII